MKQIFLEFGVAENQRSSGSRNTEKKWVINSAIPAVPSLIFNSMAVEFNSSGIP